MDSEDWYGLTVRTRDGTVLGVVVGVVAEGLLAGRLRVQGDYRRRWTSRTDSPPASHPADPPLVRPHACRTRGPATCPPAPSVEARHGARDPLLKGGRRSGGGHECSG
jgi:hypothetical protein